MKCFLIIFFIIVSLPILSFSDDGGKKESSVKSFNDYVKIRHMPSRVDFYNKEPVSELKSESRTIIVVNDGKVMGTNDSIKQIYDWAKMLEDKGITSNQQFFHVSTKKIEVLYMGKMVSLEYAESSNAKKYAQYEKEWLKLYKFVYQYLTKDIIP